MLQFEKHKCTEYTIGWKSKEVYSSKHIALHGAFLPNIKYFRKKIGIQLNSIPLVIE